MRKLKITFLLFPLIYFGCRGRSQEDKFAFAAGKGDLQTLTNLYSKKLNIDKRESEFLGNTPLTAAVWFHQPAVVSYLIDKGARNREGDTPLLLAVNFSDGYKDIVPLLIRAGANVNATNTNGFSVLYFAQQKGHESVLPMLLKAGAHLSKHDDFVGQGALLPDASSLTNRTPAQIEINSTR